MIDLHAYGRHIAAWQAGLDGKRMSWCDRARVRRALARRYRAVGLPGPRHVVVHSPITAAIAAGIAAGVRWLQRHPEAHAPLFGRTLDEAELHAASRETINAITARFELRPSAAYVAAVVRYVTDRPAGQLPAIARASAREVESIAAAPRLAAEEGDIDEPLIGGPIDLIRDEIYTRLEPEDHVPLPAVNDMLGIALDHVLDENVSRDPVPTFLGRTLAAWWSTQRSIAERRRDLAFVAFFRRRRALGLDYRAVSDVEPALRRCGGVFTHADFWIAADRPALARDEQRRPHRTGGAAVTWRDGAGLAFLHGVRVRLAISEGKFGIGEILNEVNAEVRRTMIELYEKADRGRFLREADADVLHIDYDRLGHRRRLLRVPLPGDEPYVGVEVTNSTPEPDGTHKHYILRVPPQTTTCRAGIAWTFGLDELEYEPEAET